MSSPKQPQDFATMPLGDILRYFDLVSEDQLNAALKEQTSDEKIGDALVRMRVVTREDVDNALKLQGTLRSQRSLPAALALLEATKKGARSRIEALEARFTPRHV